MVIKGVDILSKDTLKTGLFSWSLMLLFSLASVGFPFITLLYFNFLGWIASQSYKNKEKLLSRQSLSIGCNIFWRIMVIHAPVLVLLTVIATLISTFASFDPESTRIPVALSLLAFILFQMLNFGWAVRRVGILQSYK